MVCIFNNYSSDLKIATKATQFVSNPNPEQLLLNLNLCRTAKQKAEKFETKSEVYLLFGNT